MSLTVEKLCSWYGQAQVLYDLNLSVADGEVVAVLGRNGAGKTTLLRAVAGLQRRVSGKVMLDATDLTALPAHGIAVKGLTLVREGGKMASSLTVLESLTLGARLGRARGVLPRPLKEIWHLFPLLQPLGARKAGLLSGGQRQALALAVAFIARPSVLLLDEPSAGLAPPIARDLFKTIAQLAITGTSILVVEQYPAWLKGIAARRYLLELGHITNEGPLDSSTMDTLDVFQLRQGKGTR